MNILEKQNCPECQATVVNDMQNGEIICSGCGVTPLGRTFTLLSGKVIFISDIIFVGDEGFELSTSTMSP